MAPQFFIGIGKEDKVGNGESKFKKNRSIVESKFIGYLERVKVRLGIMPYIKRKWK